MMSLAETTDPRIKLPVFEGPLDLLLFLIRKNELDIYDIPIDGVLQQYLDVLYTMRTLQLEVAGEFFVMAATLLEIKSRLLLPKEQRPQEIIPGESEEGLDPRWELVHQLVQYRTYKELAETLETMAERESDRYPRDPLATAGLQPERPLQPVDRMDLWSAFNAILRRLAERVHVGEITEDTVTVADQMELILAKLETGRKVAFTTLFAQGRLPLRTLVASFLAVLELVRLSKIAVTQEAAFAEIYLEGLNGQEEGLQGRPG